MTKATITYLVATCAGIFGLAAFVGLILMPAVSSYRRVTERIAAAFLSLYVLAALLVVGAVAGGAIIYFWPRFF